MNNPDKICYTAIFSDYEDLKEPTVITPGWKYVCFTDQPLTSNVWQIVHKDVIDTPRRTARWFKIMGWIDWEYSMWVDASFQINVDLNEWWQRYFKVSFNAAKHPLRTSIYREIAFCLASNRGEADKLMLQDKDYKAFGVPDHMGIITSGMLLRENTPECIELCERWWQEVSKYSTRDQVAFARVSLGYNIHTFAWDYSQSKELKYVKHYHLR